MRLTFDKKDNKLKTIHILLIKKNKYYETVIIIHEHDIFTNILPRH